MLADMPNTYAKSIGFPVYDLLNSVAIESEKLYIRADEIEAKLRNKANGGEVITKLTLLFSNSSIKSNESPQYTEPY